MHNQQGKHTINWGGLTKNILATAAIVAGVVVVAPGLSADLFATVKEVGAGLANSVTEIGSGMASAATENASPLAEGMGWLIKKAAGIALVIGGYKYLTSE